MSRRISVYPLALALTALGGCTVRSGFVPVQAPPTPARGYCAPPALELCTTEGESAFWGPGPNTYCATDDGSEWHVGDVLTTRYVKEPGTYHSAKHTLCEVTPDGRVVFDATAQPAVLQ